MKVADVVRDEDEWSELCRHLACEEDRDESVRLLVTAGADASLANEVTFAIIIHFTAVIRHWLISKFVF